MATPVTDRFRQLNGRLGALTRHHPDGDTTDLRRELAVERLDAFIRDVVDQAPALSAEQRDKLAVLLRGADHRDGAQVGGP